MPFTQRLQRLIRDDVRDSTHQGFGDIARHAKRDHRGPEKNTKTEKGELAVHGPRDGSSTTALVVEDDPDLREILQHFLRSRDFLTLSASDGIDALDVVSRVHIDVLLTDVNMPRMDGIGVVTALRSLGLRIPIVVLTSDTSPSTRSKAIAAGANSCLWKPIDFNLLGDWLAQSRPRMNI